MEYIRNISSLGGSPDPNLKDMALHSHWMRRTMSRRSRMSPRHCRPCWDSMLRRQGTLQHYQRDMGGNTSWKRQRNQLRRSRSLRGKATLLHRPEEGTGRYTGCTCGRSASQGTLNHFHLDKDACSAWTHPQSCSRSRRIHSWSTVCNRSTVVHQDSQSSGQIRTVQCK
jgi:hypothetical protein